MRAKSRQIKAAGPPGGCREHGGSGPRFSADLPAREGSGSSTGGQAAAPAAHPCLNEAADLLTKSESTGTCQEPSSHVLQTEPVDGLPQPADDEPTGRCHRGQRHRPWQVWGDKAEDLITRRAAHASSRYRHSLANLSSRFRHFFF